MCPIGHPQGIVYFDDPFRAQIRNRRQESIPVNVYLFAIVGRHVPQVLVDLVHRLGLFLLLKKEALLHNGRPVVDLGDRLRSALLFVRTCALDFLGWLFQAVQIMVVPVVVTVDLFRYAVRGHKSRAIANDILARDTRPVCLVHAFRGRHLAQFVHHGGKPIAAIIGCLRELGIEQSGSCARCDCVSSPKVMRGVAIRSFGGRGTKHDNKYAVAQQRKRRSAIVFSTMTSGPLGAQSFCCVVLVFGSSHYCI
mmetsp:Transcript_15256/g.38432  ORF Transcript_15256/g.38432 Transcript_15256/m.38432 type:complete len:252 (+) Transcript_15256:2854-3609(+)